MYTTLVYIVSQILLNLGYVFRFCIVSRMCQVSLPYIKLNRNSQKLTCSITSGAIQQGVPTNVWRTFSLDASLPVANQADTPKSAICTVPSSPSKIFPALMSLKFQKQLTIALAINIIYITTYEFVHYCENIQVPLILHAIQLQLCSHQIRHSCNLKLSFCALLCQGDFHLSMYTTKAIK